MKPNVHWVNTEETGNRENLFKLKDNKKILKNSPAPSTILACVDVDRNSANDRVARRYLREGRFVSEPKGTCMSLCKKAPRTAAGGDASVAWVKGKFSKECEYAVVSGLQTCKAVFIVKGGAGHLSEYIVCHFGSTGIKTSYMPLFNNVDIKNLIKELAYGWRPRILIGVGPQTMTRDFHKKTAGTRNINELDLLKECEEATQDLNPQDLIVLLPKLPKGRKTKLKGTYGLSSTGSIFSSFSVSAS